MVNVGRVVGKCGRCPGKQCPGCLHDENVDQELADTLADLLERYQDALKELADG